MRIRTSFCAAAASIILSGSPAAADPIADFYRGRTIALYVGGGSGATYEMYARLLAAYLPDHIPGRPTIVVKTGGEKGGGSIKDANYMQRVAPRDGTALAIILQTIVANQVLDPQALAQYDVRTWRWIGLMAPARNMLAVWHTAPAQTIDEATRHEVIVGATSKGSPTYIVPRAMNGMLGTRFKIVLGYSGVSDLNLAMERGEIFGRGASWLSVETGTPNYITERKLKALVVDGLSKEPSLPDVPLLVDLARDELQRRVMTLISSSAEFGRAVFAPPDVPADRLAALRRGFQAALRDERLLADAARRQAPIDPQPGERLDKIAQDVVSSPPEVVARARELLGAGESR
jgi:tripartite-type tricarboxylate transporter receptor subunit TctC